MSGYVSQSTLACTGRTGGTGRTWWGTLRIVGLVLAMSALAGCSSPGDASELYLQRLAGALDQPAPHSVAGGHPLALFPGGSELRLGRLAPKLGVLDAPAIHRCQLGPLVAERNGALGRVQQPSQRFLYDVALLKGLRNCAEPSAELKELQQARAGELGASLFNALFAGEEWHAFVTPPAVAIEQPIDRQGVQRTIAELKAIVEQPLHTNPKTLEGTLATLRFSQALGRQRFAWRAQSETLEAATRMLQQARIDNPGCRTGKPTENGRTRKRVFEKYYVAGMQPELAEQAQPDRGWLAGLLEMVRTSVSAVSDQTAAERVLHWHEQVLGSGPQQEFGRWQTALANHTDAWQWQLRACGLMPGAPNPAPRAK